MQQSDLDESIYSAAVTCLDVFDLYLKSPGITEPRRDIAEELRGRFNLWAAYAGAFAAPKASLDARLVAHSDIRDMVLELLVMVQRNIIQELRLSRAIPQPDAENMEAADGDPPLLLGLNAVDAALSRLHSLAVAIRRSAARSYRQKVTLTPPSGNTEGLCYTQFVRRRFPHAGDSLIEHLGKSVHIRGRAMFYQQRHNKKIAENREREDTAMPAMSENTEPTIEDGGPEDLTMNANPMSETNVSNIDRQDLHRRLKITKPSLSHISRGSSIQESQDDKFDYPKIPRTKETGDDVPCPFCCEPLKLSTLTEKEWRDHVDRDMEPYVCISEECKEPLQFFVHSQDWRDHMQRMHTLDWARNVYTTTWHCDMDHDHVPKDRDMRDFNDKGDFIEHLSKAHGETLTRPQLLARTRRSRTARIRDPFTCPLCDCQPEDIAPHIPEKPYDLLSKHIARHLKALAFLSLSYLDFDQDFSESSGSGNQLSQKDGVDSANASIRDESFDDILPTVVSENERLVDGQTFIEPRELNDPVTWPRRLLRDFPERDDTLESFAAAIKKAGNEVGMDSRITDWITPVNYDPQQAYHFSMRVPGTDQWFLEAAEFQAWLHTAKQTLFCPGIPGVGKTIITASVIEYLHSRFRDRKDIGIAYIYCNFQQQDEQKAEDLLASVLKQLAQRQSTLSAEVKDLYNRHQKNRTIPSLEETSRTLHSVAATYLRVFIIADALDECRTDSLKRFLEEVFKLQGNTGANIFATSRPSKEISNCFSECLSLPISTAEADIMTYLSAKIPPLLSETEHMLVLQAGQAHGVLEGDSFILYPSREASQTTGSQDNTIVATATQIQPLTSTLVLEQAVTSTDQEYSVAEPQTRQVQDYAVTLDADIVNEDEGLSALSKLSLSDNDSTDRPCLSFSVTAIESEYKISDSSGQEVRHLPVMQRDCTSSDDISAVLEHLARYEFVKNLSNPSTKDDFLSSVNVNITTKTGNCFGPGSVIDIEQDGIRGYMFELRVENKGEKDLYLHVFSLGPSWQIENMLRRNFEILPPMDQSRGLSGRFSKKLKTEVPDEIRDRGFRSCDDFLKVLVTSQPTSFHIFELPKIGEAGKNEFLRLI
ncbi:hypothetical protein CDV36_003671 [Fusarium kuroshium]|uniref:Nephrocystin 3-like N-terminal domain-containing protein n=1 Tax=Fusarium kuroshium TaxID=2010991 RepID=A0A3M2SGH0_9HYPO|nr:hypothetical protein CDV36_003671 [Fusarium kuroshium]